MLILSANRCFLANNFVRYQIEFEGNLQACLEQEQLKIFGYATLPENLKRDIPIIRPPGNKQDR